MNHVPFQPGETWNTKEVWAHRNQGAGLTRCGRCRGVFWQSGNQTSHCGSCCRTFTSLAAFDAHFEHIAELVLCNDPITLLNANGDSRFELVTGYHLGETVVGYWRFRQ